MALQGLRLFPHPSVLSPVLFSARGERRGVILAAAQCHVSPRIAVKRPEKAAEASVSVPDGSRDPG